MKTVISPEESVLMVMSHAKLGDFLLLTPHLQRLQRTYSGLIIAVPDMLRALYEDNKIFTRTVAFSDVSESVRQPARKPSKHIVNLTYPLLDNAQIPEHHIRLRSEHFLRPRHVFTAYREALLEIFPDCRDLPAEPESFLNDRTCPVVLGRYGLKRYMYFTVHAGSDFAPKNWDPQRFEDCVQQLLHRHSHLTCVSLVGPQDDELFQNSPAPKRFLSLKVPLTDAATLLAGSLFHIDNDSGVSHLAGAINVPSITVFGPTAPGTWASMAQMNFVHWGGPNCADHCEGARMHDCPDRVCLNSVKPEDLILSADRILRNYAHFAL